MPKLIVKGVDGIVDGDYELPTLLDMTQREKYFIRQTCGLSGNAIVGAMLDWLGGGEGDAAFAVALAAVAATRAGKTFDIDAFWDAPGRPFTFDFSDVQEEEKDDPPAQPPGDSSEPGSPGGTEGEPETSGSDTSAPSGNPA